MTLTTRPTRDDLVAAADPEDLSVRSLLDFCSVPQAFLEQVAALAAPEDWGDALLKYFAAHVPLAIEQGRYVWNGKELVMRAGNLATARGTALYVGLSRAEGPRWELSWAGERPANVEALVPATLGPWPEIDLSLEVVVGVDLFRPAALAGLPAVAQSAAVSGTVEWSLRRGLSVRHPRGYFVPVHLTSRETVPDAVAALQVQRDRLVVRWLVELRDAYPAARAVVEWRADLPAWLVGE